ncbi:Lipoxygenase 2 [Citrus sinensis]|nr:Lipoxygenase 2 [Citrus sinensis]
MFTAFSFFSTFYIKSAFVCQDSLNSTAKKRFLTNKFTGLVHSSPSFQKSLKIRVGFSASNNIKAIAGATAPSVVSVKVKAVVTVKRTILGGTRSNNREDVTYFEKPLFLGLVCAELDSNGSEKPTINVYASVAGVDLFNIRYEAEFEVPSSFGDVGGILVQHENQKEMYLKDVVLDGFLDGPMNITCDSWVQPLAIDAQKRVFFTNKSYLPSQTPNGLTRLRDEELISLRGSGQGERQPYDRIYDYDVYNDLGDPDNNPELHDLCLVAKSTLILGVAEQDALTVQQKIWLEPYKLEEHLPDLINLYYCTDPESETRSDSNYVPRDEAFSRIKQATFSAKTLYSLLHGLIPAIKAAFGENKDLGHQFFWFRDEEFGRQTLAGLNPCAIQLVTKWPLESTLDPAIYGPPESAITTERVEKLMGGDITVAEAIEQKKLFILDYNDLLLPYVEKVRQLEGTTLYRSRTLFFLTSEGTLRPLVIELTRPPMNGQPQWKQAFQPSWQSTESWLWRLAKAHVLAHDSGYHQLVSHWLRTHACTEPYVTATTRHLSAMHPICTLLKPHLRGMAVDDPTAPNGLKLTIEDYPYANDGLNLWFALKKWVTDSNHDQSLVQSDKELQAWWTEIRTVGHADKKDEPWWPALKTSEDLIEIITTIVWVASGHHAAVNFGQYAYAGYVPNRPSIARTNMPTEEPISEKDMKFFLENPQVVLLRSFPTQLQAIQVMAVLDVLSTHSPDEEYLGNQMEPTWGKDPTIFAAFERFSGRMMELEGIIDERNADMKLKNRNGARVVPYELLKPFSGRGVTEKGVPYSISI